MAQITFTIPDDKVAELRLACADFRDIPVDQQTRQPVFTQPQWVKELGRRFYVDVLRTYRTKQAYRSAEAGLPDPNTDLT